ncbi:cache domain-containing sensor histidine kinase [Paenibacillus thalictri]|nr:sensor histidine kinase [Paenibacillus thalictri]
MAFVLLILLPFSVLNMYNYQKIETLIQVKISEESHSQLESLYHTLQDQMSTAFKTLIFLEQDSSIQSILETPQMNRQLDNIELVEKKFKGLNNSFFLYNPPVYFTVLDLHGSVYTSYKPKDALDYDQLRAHSRFQEALEEGAKYRWVSQDDNYLFRDNSSSPSLLSMYAVMRDQNKKPYGLARASIDYSYWFQSMLSSASANKEYFIITGEGEQAAQSVPHTSLTPNALQQIKSKPSANGYFIDSSSDALINYTYIDSLDWYMVDRVPLHILYKQIHELKQNYFVTFGLFTAAFMIIAFMIAFTFTRPLSHMQKKMRDAVRKDLKVRLPEKRYKGEILELTRSFNTILDDMDDLVQRLKAEERQKDAVHFQMLLAQMNPHFLLNTLNTLKWIALRNEQTEIAEITMSLGKLLEASLNSDVDLIYLKDEMELIRAFVYIQQRRYNNRFEIHYDYDRCNEYVLVPKLSLQPLVENAILHGIAHRSEGGTIRLRIACTQQGNLIVEVEDNGVGIVQAARQQTTRKRPGIGLDNVRQRLKLLFKDHGALEIISLTEGTLVRMTMPYLLSEPYQNRLEL